jgi:ribosome biogenesis GTPase A
MKEKFSWYPGHIKKAEEELRSKWLPLIDLVIEVVDGRVPISGIYPHRDIWQAKKVIRVFSKKDLVPSHPYFKQSNFLLIDARLPHLWQRKLNNIIKANAEAVNQKLHAQGRHRNLRIGVCGLPNVGKSTFLNSLGGLGKKAKTGDKPGITRQMQFIRGAEFDLLDTPGIMPHSLETAISRKLALCGLLPAKLFDPAELAFYLQEVVPKIKTADQARKCESAESLIKAFQAGKLGKFFLDSLE